MKHPAPLRFASSAAALAWLTFALIAPAQATSSGGIPPDVIVAADGTGQFTSIQAAIESLPRDNHERRIIHIRPGVYREKVRIDANDITLDGAGREVTRIAFAQGATEFRRQPDKLGIGVVNINGDDCVVENLTIENTQGVIGVHAFAVYGRGDRTVIQDCDVLSQGNDTLSLWRTNDRQFDDAAGNHASPNGRYYHARLRVRGSVDFICPRGWCYMKDSEIYQVNPRAEAAIWHDGSRDPNMQFVLRDCHFDGVEGWQLARHHHDAQFYLLDCTFSAAMKDVAPHRVVYPLGGKPATEADRKRNSELDATNRWGERFYWWNCHRAGGDYGWMKNNLAAAPGSPTPAMITAAWTFDGRWDPENPHGPVIRHVTRHPGGATVEFSESVTVKGRPRLVAATGGVAGYRSGSGSTTLEFSDAGTSAATYDHLDLDGGAIIATEASAAIRPADLTFP